MIGAGLLACSQSETEAGVDEVLARDRAAAHFELEEYAQARAALDPLLASEDVAVEDLLRAVNVELDDNQAAWEPRLERAQGLLERATRTEPENPIVLWSRYRIAKNEADFESAMTWIERLFQIEPDDYPTRLAYANTLYEMERLEEAEAQYKALLELGGSFGADWQMSSLHRYFTLLLRQGRSEEADQIIAQKNALHDSGFEAVGGSVADRGTFGVVQPATPGRVALSEAEWEEWMNSSAITSAIADLNTLALPGIRGLVPAARRDARTVERIKWGDGWISPQEARDQNIEFPLVLAVAREAGEVLVWGEFGVRFAWIGPAGWEFEEVLATSTVQALPFDIDFKEKVGSTEEYRRDGRVDVVAQTEDGLVLVEQTDSGWETRTDVGLSSFHASNIVAVDFDHEGDLDLLAVGPDGTRLWRNDGVGAPGGRFTDVTSQAGLPRERGFAWCSVEDPDGDNDVDLILGGPDGVFYARSERGGLFSDASGSFPEAAATVARPTFVDLNTDGWTDLLPMEPGASAIAGSYDRWTPQADYPVQPLGPTIVCEDLDHDARLESLCATADGFALRPPSASAPEVTPGSELGGVAVSDLDADGTTDFVTTDGGELRAHRVTTSGSGIGLSLQGVKDNRRGVGAIVEIRTGPAYRRVYWRGQPMTLGLGGRKACDVVRITWPNGIVQVVLDLEAGQEYRIRQREGPVGSCPFLYTWNGETYEFISDVLGITPLGLPMARGQLVPPDHDEYVLVRGEQLVPREGAYEIQITEELREVTYLDQVQLLVIDHPEGTEIYPNERFCFPPFPEAHTHTVRDPLPPTHAVDDQGRDHTSALTAIDGTYADGLEPLRDQFQGLAHPHHLELSFDKAQVARAEKLRLLMTGWLYWSDASVNVAAADHPTVSFDPPVLLVPDGTGGWRSTGPPIGFPAGKTKTMVIDVTELMVRDDPRVRIQSSLQLYWDSIRLAVDGDDAELRVTTIDPDSANLWERGFSRPVTVNGIAGMDWFEWDQIENEPRWNQHPGLYTRYGDVLPLLTEIDDMFVIFGAGDALTVRFPADAVKPPQDGYRRDFLVFFDGWAKDRDPNTKEALHVEPLPFHGMTGYPYGPDERYPDDPEHRAYRLEWNTRYAKRWIEPMAVDVEQLRRLRRSVDG